MTAEALRLQLQTAALAEIHARAEQAFRQTIIELADKAQAAILAEVLRFEDDSGLSNPIMGAPGKLESWAIYAEDESKLPYATMTAIGQELLNRGVLKQDNRKHKGSRYAWGYRVSRGWLNRQRKLNALEADAAQKFAATFIPDGEATA